MSTELRLVAFTHRQLFEQIVTQLNFIHPLRNKTHDRLVYLNLKTALHRTRLCINSVKLWIENEFNPQHSSQYCIFLYFLANTIWRESGSTEIPTSLFSLNKMLNGIDLFYEIEMPERFFIGHSVGIVFAKAKYSDYFAVYQNSTVGKNHGIAPVIESGVLMYPNSAIIGRSLVRSNTVIAQGVGIINKDTPGESIAFRDGDEIKYKPLKRNILKDIFR